MAKFSRIEVALKMRETGIVPVFYHHDEEVCLRVMKACYSGGIRVFEFTNRGDFAHEIFLTLNKYAARKCPEMILGAGSVLDAGTASLYIQSGSNFIVSPALKKDIALTCNRRKILYAPGCGTVTEISEAEELVVEVVKVFPGEQVGGPKYIAAVKGPCPWTSIMPTGGVAPTEESLTEWFDAGAHCVGIGSQLITKKIIENKDFEELERKVREVMQIMVKLRKK